jgi:hypothetical protein
MHYSHATGERQTDRHSRQSNSFFLLAAEVLPIALHLVRSDGQGPGALYDHCSQPQRAR